MSTAKEPGKIQRLDPAVVNRIAAGEVVQYPSSALKELLENSLDAGATQISITTADAGLKSLQIHDNGCGMRKEDLTLACERHATSKLNAYEDLRDMRTFGFRGEALASISLCSRLTITTRVASSTCAYRAYYIDGVMQPTKPGDTPGSKPCAGKVGTQILVEDLFYNNPIRRKSFRSLSEEYQRILEVVTRYAILNRHVSFTLKKVSSVAPDVHTSGMVAHKIPSNPKILPDLSTLIRAIYSDLGLDVSLHPIELDGSTLTSSRMQNVRMTGMISGPNVPSRKPRCILFINDRLVKCDPLKSAIETHYQSYLPKGKKPFLYLSLTIPPSTLDVNIHPTKREVRFLNEEEICSAVAAVVADTLYSAGSSKLLSVTQSMSVDQLIKPIRQSTLLTESSGVTVLGKKRKAEDNQIDPGEASLSRPHNPISSSARHPAPNREVRSDQRSQSLHGALHRASQRLTPQPEPPSRHPGAYDDINNGSQLILGSTQTTEEGSSASTQSSARSGRVHVELASVLSLRNDVLSQVDEEMTTLFAEHVFVGFLDHSHVILQHGVGLYIVELESIIHEYIYQRALWDFANFGRILLHPAPSLVQLLTLGEEGMLMPEAESAVTTLFSHADMLDDYFSIGISGEGQLLYLPLILPGYIPPLHRTASFIRGLATKINWLEERPCLEGICRLLGDYYAPSPEDVEEMGGEDNGQGSWRDILQHTVVEATRKLWVVPKALSARKTAIAPLTSLPILYRVFERC